MTLRWQYRETRDSEIATFHGAGFTAVVCDGDGDRSWWEVKKGGQTLAIGEGDGFAPYHFHAAIDAAESALRGIVNERKETLLMRRRERDASRRKDGGKND